jgi:small subunit ribosomal protein S18
MSDDKQLSAVRMDKDMVPETGGKARGRRRRKVSYLTLQKIEHVDYKETNILRRFINDRGKMVSSRQTGNTAKQQRMIARAIRRARELALLPFVVTEMTNEKREYTPRSRAPRPEREQAPAPEATEE